MAQLRLAKQRIQDAGAEVVVVGSGRPEQARDFASAVGFDGPIYCDKTLEAYKEAGLKRGVLRTFNPKSMINAVRAFFGGNRQGRTQGDPWQQGGLIFVTPDGKVHFHHADGVAGERPDVPRLIEVVEQVGARRKLTLGDNDTTAKLRKLPK